MFSFSFKKKKTHFFLIITVTHDNMLNTLKIHPIQNPRNARLNMTNIFKHIAEMIRILEKSPGAKNKEGAANLCGSS